MMYHGIDVSEHNGAIDWQGVKGDKVKFAMLRMGFGSDIPSQDDAQFERNVRECERLGIPWGATLYDYALNEKEVKSQIAHARRLLKGKNPQYPVAFDMEDADHYKERHGMPSDKFLVDNSYQWLDALEGDGFYVTLYADKYWLDTKLKSSKLDRFDKWVAQWGKKCTYDGSHQMWQYSNRGRVRGIRGLVDMDISYTNFNFDVDHLRHHVPYVIQSGDTLTGIAKKYKTTIKYLIKLNPQIHDADEIYAGTRILVPEV